MLHCYNIEVPWSIFTAVSFHRSQNTSELQSQHQNILPFSLSSAPLCHPASVEMGWSIMHTQTHPQECHPGDSLIHHRCAYTYRHTAAHTEDTQKCMHSHPHLVNLRSTRVSRLSPGNWTIRQRGVWELNDCQVCQNQEIQNGWGETLQSDQPPGRKRH